MPLNFPRLHPVERCCGCIFVYIVSPFEACPLECIACPSSLGIFPLSLTFVKFGADGLNSLSYIPVFRNNCKPELIAVKQYQ